MNSLIMQVTSQTQENLLNFLKNFGVKRLTQKYYMIFSLEIQVNKAEEYLDYQKAEEN